MKRLTFDGCFCDIAQCMEPEPCKYKGMCDQRKTWERLKAYEDTGLEPEEIPTGLELAKVACALQEMKNTSDELNRIKTERQALKDEIDYLKKRLEIEKDHSAQMERERDAAVADLMKAMLCIVCEHGIFQTGIPCDERPDRPADGSCDFVWRGVQDKKRLSSTSSKE